MNDIPLVKDNGINAINTSLIAAKKSLQLIYSILDNVNKTFKDINKEIDAIDAKFADYLLKDDVVNSITDNDMRPVTSNAVAQIAPVDTVASGNLHSVTSNAVANNTIQKINISVQEADLETNIKAFLDEMSSKPINTYSGVLNSSISNGNYNLSNFYDENTNWRSTIGIIEFDLNYGVYYVFRISSGSDTPYYIVRRIDIPTISAQNNATRIDARFPSGSYTYCYWWRCGRTVTVRFYSSAVLSTFNHLDPCYSGLPKPIWDSMPQSIPQWGGQPTQFTIIIDNDGNLCTNGNANGGTDVVVSGECSFTYITRDD